MTKTMMLAASALGLLAASGGAQAQSSAPGGSAGQAAATGATGGTTGGAAPSAAAPGLAQGSTVYDQQGGTVGKIESLDGDFAVLATAKSKVKLPKSSFGTGDKGPVIAMTAAQLDQAAAQAAPAAGAQAATAANVIKGAQVADPQGGAVGTVSAVDAQFATVDLASGGKVRLPVTAFGAGTNGGLRVAMTAQQLSAAAGAAGAQTSTGG